LRLNIGPRLILCFVFIVLSMSGGDAVLLWQFHLVRLQAERLDGLDQELVAVLQLHASLLAFRDRLEAIANYEDAKRLASEAGSLNRAVLEDTERAKSVLSGLSSGVQPDPTIMPTLEVIQRSFQSQLEAIMDLATRSDWSAVRLRLASQVHPLEFLSSTLVEKVDREVGEEQAQAGLNFRRVERWVFAVVPMTVVFTLVIAATLGLAITRSITQPLARLVECSRKLAQGEFHSQVAIQGEDELARLGHVFNDTADKLRSLYEDIRRSEAYLAEGQHLSRTGTFSWRTETDEVTWSEELYRIYELQPGTPTTLELSLSRIHPDDLGAIAGAAARARETGADFERELRLSMPDNSIKYLHVTAHAARDHRGRLEYIGAAQDITQRRLAEEALAKARSELASVARTSTLGVLTASIAHEVNQPLSGIITNSGTCLRMLSIDPPNIEGARETARRTMRDGSRAAEVIARLRALYSNKELSPESMDLNDATREVTSLTLSEMQRNRVILRQELADDLPLITGDRIQLQQVILNLLRNACDAMSAVDDRPRELFVRTELGDGDGVRLSVKDTGVGFKADAADKLFQAFYTTKNDGMGIGLSISRSIIEAHQGRLWAAVNNGPGVTFSFSVPCGPVGGAIPDQRPDASLGLRARGIKG
jgi:signal transduction histidine kinase/HAMP domain-containing protein